MPTCSGSRWTASPASSRRGIFSFKVSLPNTPASLVTLADLEADPHPALARLRAAAPVSWVPALGAWLVTGYDLAVAVLRDARTFTVDDPRFSTAKVVGPSMLSLDGPQHARHRGPFNRAFRREEIYARLASFTWAETGRLVSVIEPRGAAELRRAVAGPLAVTVMAEALGLGPADPGRVLAWYDGIVAAVQAEAAADGGPAAGPAGAAAFAELAASLREVIAAPGSASLLSAAAGPLTEAEAISNAAVMMFGGIETTEGMIANALLHLLSSPAELELVLTDRTLVTAAIEESLRLEPPRRWSTGTPPGTPGSAMLASGPASRSRCPFPERTGTRRSSASPGCSTSAVPTPDAIWPSRTARTSASAPTWPGWRRRWPSKRCWTGSPGCAWIPATLARRAASSFASRLTCACAGTGRR